MHIFKLFILDDDTDTNLITSIILEDVQVNDYHFETNGWEALNYLEESKNKNEFPNLILVDLKMPAMDGFEFVENYEQKFWKQFPTTKLVVLTSSISSRDKQKALSYPSVSYFLTKPLTEEKIKELIQFAS